MIKKAVIIPWAAVALVNALAATGTVAQAPSVPPPVLAREDRLDLENRLLRLELMRGQMRELERAFGETQRELSDRVAQLQIEGFALDLATLRYQRTPTEATTP